MNETLLQTRLYMPPLPPNVVPRPRLVERLNEGIQQSCKLILISAPAGFGKSTLVSSWISQLTTENVAWLTLDEADNDPIRFLAYFVAALQEITPGLDTGFPQEGSLSLVQPLDQVMARLINEMAVVSQRLILILDDYHLIKAQPIHTALTYLLNHLPSNMHLVVSTRVDPPLPISRLRSQGQLAEVRLRDLRFEPAETDIFLNQAIGYEIANDDISALTTRTEGWIAGLQLAAVSMREQEDIVKFIRDFTGSHRYIMDYLIEEVLDRQSNQIQQFLLQTSILERVTGSLCDAVLRIEDWGSEEEERPPRPSARNERSQSILEYLERANLFIVSLDEERHWYRYHRLFADLLRKRLQQTQPDQVPILHSRASEWFEQNGQMKQAIEHALSAKEYERSMYLLEHVTEVTLMRSEVATFLKWVGALPEDLIRSRPSLRLYCDCARVLSGHSLDEVSVSSIDLETEDGLAPGQAAALQALIATFQGRFREAAELSEQALANLPEDKLFLRNLAAWSLAYSPLQSDDFTSSKKAMEEVARSGQRIGNITVTAGALCAMAEIARMMGQLHEAAAHYQRVLEIATDAQGHPFPVAGIALVGLGKLAREWNDLETAEQHLNRGLDLVRQLREIEALDGYLSLALVRLAQGDPDQAQKAIGKAQQLLLDFDEPVTEEALVEAYQARLWLAQGDTGAALRWAKKFQLAPDTVLTELKEVDETGGLLRIRRKRRWAEYVTLAHLWIALDRAAETLPFLERLQQFEERMELQGRVLGVLVIKALALQEMGKINQAVATLNSALSLAESEGYIRIFLDEGPAMAKLLGKAMAGGTVSDYAKQLLAAFDQAKSSSFDGKPTAADLQPSAFTQNLLTDPLSEREMEVLRLLKTSLTVPEIADQLFIAPSTVRSHIKNIYSKLNAHRRWEAVARAEEFGLL